MIFGFDTSGQNVITAFRHWEELNTAASLLLISCSTTPDPDAPIYEAEEHAFRTGTARLLRKLDEIGSSAGCADIMYAATTLAQECTSLHSWVRELSLFNGQGIYLSGIITYLTPEKFLLLPFGSSAAYTFKSGKLKRQGPQVDEKLVHNAIGGADTWKPQCWEGDRIPGMHIICTSQPLPSPEDMKSVITENSLDTSHPNTVSMVLRRNLDVSATGLPTAVLELKL